MLNKLIKKFLCDNLKSEKNKRYVVARKSSILGIFSNICLFLIKISIGLFTKSISIISDAFNNLSDSLSFIISLVGLHFAEKPADKEHPFGHGRVEYIAAFILTIIIIIAGFEFIVESVKRILNPSSINKSISTIILLLLTMIIKLLLSYFFKVAGEEIDSMILKASSEDSRNDILITGVVLIAVILNFFNSHISFDGIAGIIVSIFIFISGYNLIKSTITMLLGSEVDEELLKDIKALLIENDNIYGVHDVVVHDYGPNVKMGSGHVEMSNKLTLDEAHNIIDAIEGDINNKFGVNFTIHIDPVNITDEEYKSLYKRIEEVTRNIDKELTFHDLYFNKDDKEISFDIAVPFNLNISNEEIEDIIRKELYEYHVQLSIDRGYTVSRS